MDLIPVQETCNELCQNKYLWNFITVFLSQCWHSDSFAAKAAANKTIALISFRYIDFEYLNLSNQRESNAIRHASNASRLLLEIALIKDLWDNVGFLKRNIIFFFSRRLVLIVNFIATLRPERIYVIFTSTNLKSD